jgi:hypothetical protein
LVLRAKENDTQENPEETQNYHEEHSSMQYARKKTTLRTAIQENQRYKALPIQP